ncbi:hypothetical protein [Rhizobium leguminosarum]
MVQLANLQSVISRRSLKPLYAVLLFRVGETAQLRAFLRDLLPRIGSGDTIETADVPVMNVFMSWRAISTLVAGHPYLDPTIGRRQFEPFFTDPLQAPDSLAMAEQLGFTGPSAPEHWWAEFRSGDIDLAVYLGCNDDEERQRNIFELREAASSMDLTELTLPSFPGSAITGYTPAGGRLHFGYRDGITTPDVDWEDNGRPDAVNFREFVMGYPTADYPTTPYPEGPWRDFARDGSFACLTWIQQDVTGFESFLSRHAPSVAPSLPESDPREWLAAQLMGRWRDGSPLVRHPGSPPSVPDMDNAFGYIGDPTGAQCPFGAHIRVAHSRDQPLSFANKSRFPKGPPRLIRRGFSYGEPWISDDDKDRGLFGIFLCSRVNEQFYTVLRWMQQTEFSPVFDDAKPGRAGQDMLIGSRLPGGTNRMPDSDIHVAVGDTRATISLQPFIRYRGAAVLFVPSMASLRDVLEI